MQIESSYIRAGIAIVAAGAFFAACRTPVVKQLAQGVISKLPTTALPYATHNLAGRIAAGSASTATCALLFGALTPKQQPSTSTPPDSHNDEPVLSDDESESGMHIFGREYDLTPTPAPRNPGSVPPSEEEDESGMHIFGREYDLPPTSAPRNPGSVPSSDDESESGMHIFGREYDLPPTSAPCSATSILSNSLDIINYLPENTRVPVHEQFVKIDKTKKHIQRLETMIRQCRKGKRGRNKKALLNLQVSAHKSKVVSLRNCLSQLLNYTPAEGIMLNESTKDMLEYDQQKERYYATLLKFGLPRGWESPQWWTPVQPLPRESYEVLNAALPYTLLDPEILRIRIAR